MNTNAQRHTTTGKIISNSQVVFTSKWKLDQLNTFFMNIIGQRRAIFEMHNLSCVKTKKNEWNSIDLSACKRIAYRHSTQMKTWNFITKKLHHFRVIYICRLLKMTFTMVKFNRSNDSCSLEETCLWLFRLLHFEFNWGFFSVQSFFLRFFLLLFSKIADAFKNRLQWLAIAVVTSETCANRKKKWFVNKNQRVFFASLLLMKYVRYNSDRQACCFYALVCHEN